MPQRKSRIFPINLRKNKKEKTVGNISGGFLSEVNYMKCVILHETRGRMRVRIKKNRMTLDEADVLEYYLRAVSAVKDVKIYDRTCDAVIMFEKNRESVISALARFSFNDETAKDSVPEHTGRQLSREFEDKLFFTVAGRALKALFLPMPLRSILATFYALKYIKRGLSCIVKGKIEVPVLDATAISVSLLRGDFKTASSIMFMLKLGEILDDWTHRKSVDDLARTMSLGVDKVWLKNGEQEILVPVNEVAAGEEIVVRTGNMIPLDGRVTFGEMTVNQASMTGESAAVPKKQGSIVYAGTVVEDGECVIKVEKSAGGGRYDRIVKMIEESEKLKSNTEDKASHLADKLVPLSLGATVLTYLITKNPLKALAILMVDFSCALKLSMPVAVLSAMKEGNSLNISFKGGKFLEAVAEADTIVFDKTGTLTKATPRVARIVTFGSEDETSVLRIAACLEEHYPHSMANAVVKAASDRGINHEECHSKVEYVVAHGIIGIVDGKRVVIGSHHFVFEDEGCTIPDKPLFDSLPNEYSHLYMGIGGSLAAVICIEDPIREEAPDVIKVLYKEGFKHIVMMTGDSERTAKAVANKLGIKEYYSEVLPEDKAAFVKRAHKNGSRVVMIGDGVNDAPALSESDAGVAVNSGAAITKEIADITITADDLYSLVTMKRLADRLMQRIHGNYRFIMSFNTALIVLGVAGVLPASTSALLHNTSTLAISLKSMTDLL